MVHSDSDLILHNSSVLIDKEPLFFEEATSGTPFITRGCNRGCDTCVLLMEAYLGHLIPLILHKKEAVTVCLSPFLLKSCIQITFFIYLFLAVLGTWSTVPPIT